MLQYNDMLNLELHREVLTFPRTPKNKGLAILLNTKDMISTVSFMNNYNRIKNMTYVKSFYKDYRYKFKIFNKYINETIDVNAIYDDVQTKVDIVKNTYRNIESYKNNNIYVSLDEYNKLFFEKVGKLHGDIIINAYVELLINSTSIYSTYTTKIMVIDLVEWMDNPKNNKTYMYNKATTPFSILYSAMVRNLALFKTIPFDILLIYGRYKIRVIPSQCTVQSPIDFKSAMTKMIAPKDANFFKEGDDNPSDEQVKKDEKDDKRSEVIEILDNKLNKVVDGVRFNIITKQAFTGDTIVMEDDRVHDIQNTIKDTVDNIMDEDDELESEEINKQAEDILNKDEEFLTKLDLVSSDSFTNISYGNNKRNKILAEQQSKIKINKQGKTIDQIINNAEAKKLEPKKIKSKTLNSDMMEMKFPNLAETYNKNLLEKDTIAILNFFKDKRVPVYILDIKKEDSSTEFDKKVTYTVKMESGDRERHTLKFDLPKFIDGSFMYLGGNKKNIINQFFLNPVSKTGPDTVQLCSNYNKIFLRRSGTKLSPKIEKIKKTLSLYKGINIKSKLFFKTGDNSLVNNYYLTNIEYDELAKSYLDLYINAGEYHIFFNQENIREYIKELNLKLIENDSLLPIGIKNKKDIIYLNVEKDQIDGTEMGLVDYLIDITSNTIPEFKKDFNNMNVGKKYIYTEATIMKRKIPILLLLSYLEGLTTVLKKSGVPYRFADTRERIQDDDKSNKQVIEFADGYLIFDRYPMKNSLLLNAFSIIPTKDFNYSDFDNKEVYLSIFNDLYGDKRILNAFENFYDLFIDPITLEVLDDLNMPNDFVGLMLYANELLQDNQYVRENNLSLYRLRNNELINAYLYKVLADSYSIYRTSSGNKHPQKMSIPQDAVIKEIVMSQIVEDYSTLNPILEAEKLRASSFKGPSGLIFGSQKTFLIAGISC